MPQDSHKDQPSVPIPDKGTIERIIAQGDPEALVKWAEGIGQALQPAKNQRIA